MKPSVLMASMCALGLACAPEPREPALLSVTPSSGPGDIATPVVISGVGLDAQIDTRYDTPKLDVGVDYEARLGTMLLDSVTLRSSIALDAVIPPGLSAGSYDLAVTKPSGETLTLVNAFVVGTIASDGCSLDAVRVSDYVGLVAAVSAAAGASVVMTVCITRPIVLENALEVEAPGLVVQASAEGELVGDALPSVAAGLAFQGGSSRVENVRFSGFPGIAIRVDQGEVSIEGARFQGCRTAVATRVGATRLALVRSVVSDGNVAVGADTTPSVTIDNNTFYALATPILAERSAITLRNNIFAATGGEALNLVLTTFPVPARANAFSPAFTCTGCAAFDASNQVLDCGLRAPDAGDFTFSEVSPCVDIGVDVGTAYLGSAPDVGAFEMR